MASAGKRQRLALRIASVPMGLLALSCLYPILFAVNNAFKTRDDYLQDRFGLVTNPTLDNFVQAWTKAHLDQYFMNSVIATLGAVLVLTVVSSLAGFALASLRFPYRRFLFVVILSSLMIPVQVVLVPYMKTMVALSLINTHVGLILSYTAFFLPFSVYMMTSFYSGLPRELIEAARIDGAKLIQVWWHVMVPMGMPALVTLGIINTLNCWNDILIALLTMQKNRTLMVAISVLKGQYSDQIPLFTAGIVIAAAPIVILYIIFQRRIVSGIAVGAVKG
jgi:ABC-type glycerol-3-phosphate transport system permease component